MSEQKELPPLVGIVILNWQNRETTEACVASVRRMDYSNFLIIVVHNGAKGSHDNFSFEGDQAVQVIRNGGNLGFSGGVNVGIRLAIGADCDYIWLLNSDASVTTGTLTKLVAAAETDCTIGLVSPLICHRGSKGSVEFCAGRFDRETLSFSRTTDVNTYLEWTKEAPDRIWLVGTAMLIRRSLVEKVGFFDEKLFAYWEDNDYSIRSLDAGFRNICVPSSVAYHRLTNNNPEERRPPHFFYYITRNHILFLKKHGRFWSNIKPVFWRLCTLIRWVDSLPDSRLIMRAFCLALFDAISNAGGEYDQDRPVALFIGETILVMIRILYGPSNKNRSPRVGPFPGSG